MSKILKKYFYLVVNMPLMVNIRDKDRDLLQSLKR